MSKLKLKYTPVPSASSSDVRPSCAVRDAIDSLVLLYSPSEMSGIRRASSSDLELLTDCLRLKSGGVQ